MKLKGGYRANETAMRAEAAKNYGVDVLVEPCPACGAEGGSYCIARMYSGKPLTAPSPHPERVAVSHLGRGGQS